MTSASPLGAVTTTAYTTTGEMATQVTATGTAAAPPVTTTDSYDADGKVTSTTTGGATTKTSYDPTGTAFCTATPNAVAKGSATYRCPAWQASWISNPPSPSSLYAGTTGAKDVATTFQDAAGEQVQQTTPGGNTTETAYDPTGDPYCTVKPVEVANGVTCPGTVPTSPPTGTATGYTTTLHNATGQVTSATNPTGDTIITAYDSAGLKQAVTKGGDATTYCHYGDSCAGTAPAAGGTGTDLYWSDSPPLHRGLLGVVKFMTYTPTGTPTTTITQGATSTDTYDGAGELTGVTYSTVDTELGTPSNVTSTYNPTGTLATTTTATGTTTDTYDEAGDLTSQSFAPATGSPLAASSLAYAYTPTGKPESVTYPSYGTTSDPTVTYGYGTAGEMTSVTDWLGHTTAFSFDHGGYLTTTAFPNADTATESYDTTGAVSGVSLAPSAHPATTLATITYTRNATEQVTKEADTGDLSVTRSYGYDQSARLSTTGTHAVGYDARTDLTTLPNGATATYYDAGDLISYTTGSTTTTLTYDALGDRTTVAPSTGPIVTYGYNALGQMTSARSTAATGPLSGTGVTFTVNSTGIRVGETTSSGTQTFTWDTVGSVPSVLSDGTTAFVYGPNGEVVEQVTLTSTTPTYLVQDQLGSTRLLTDQAGTVVGTATYGPYGDETAHSGTTTPIGYAGGWTTAATGLDYLVNRYYTPQTASFLSIDPDVATTTQPYVYATDDPTNATDPTGKFTLGWCVESEAALGLGSAFAGVTNTGAVCLARTVFSPSGTDDIGLTETLGNLNGHTLGFDVSAGISVQVSNANTLHELGGIFKDTNLGFGGAPGVGANVSYFDGTASDGRKIYGADVGINLGVGASVGKFTTTTWVQQENNPILANVLRVAWDAITFGIFGQLTEVGRLIDDAISAFGSQLQTSGTGYLVGRTPCSIGTR